MSSNLPDRIFLCGFMGAGKSTLGKALAEKLEQPFLDLDRFVEREEGAAIAEIFENRGEEAFRNAEHVALLKCIQIFKGVVALGGGTLHNQQVVDHIKLNGLLIFIETPISVILDRITETPDRPLLLDDEGNTKSREVLKTEMEQRYQRRLPLYKKAVISIKSSSSDTLEMLLEKLIRKIKNHVSHH